MSICQNLFSSLPAYHVLFPICLCDEDQPFKIRNSFLSLHFTGIDFCKKMADQRYEVSLVLIVFAVIWAGVIAQESSDCTNVLITMSPCLNYIKDSSSPLFSGCCTQLNTVVDEKPECLCQVLNGGNSDLGLNINPTAASALTTACKVQTPSASRCKGSSPASQGGSNDATSTNMEAPLSLFFFFIASYASIINMT